MIFDTLSSNRNENEPLIIKTSDKKSLLDPINTPISDISSESLEEVNDENRFEFSFVEQMKAQTDTQKLEVAKKTSVETLEDGNIFPFIETPSEEIKTELVDANEIKSAYKNDTNLNDKGFPEYAVQGELSILPNEMRPILSTKETSIDQVMQKELNIVVSSKTIETNNKTVFVTPTTLKNQDLNPMPIPLQSVNNVDVALNNIAPKILNEQKLTQDLINKFEHEIKNVKVEDENIVVKDQKITKQGNIVAEQLLDVRMPIKTKNSNLNIEQNYRFTNDLPIQATALASAKSLIEISPTNSYEINSSSVVTSPVSLLNPVSEASNSLDKMIFKQVLNTNGQLVHGLSGRIQWMLQNAITRAEIKLDPPELGPLNVKLVQAGNETNIVFHVSSPQGKEAIEDSLAKLKEMLLSQGLSLGETEVQHRQNSDSSEDEKEQKLLANQANHSDLDDETNTDTLLGNNSRVSLLDTYI